MITFTSRRRRRPTGVRLLAGVTIFVLVTGCTRRPPSPAAEPPTTTPIRHLVVIFQENISFDHYFGTYPRAANIDGQAFTAKPGTPAGRRPHPRVVDAQSQFSTADAVGRAGSAGDL
jgi:phospholipase C